MKFRLKIFKFAKIAKKELIEKYNPENKDGQLI